MPEQMTAHGPIAAMISSSVYSSSLYSTVTQILPLPLKRGRPIGSKDSGPRRKPGELAELRKRAGEVKRGRPKGSKDSAPRRKRQKFPDLLDAKNYVAAHNGSTASAPRGARFFANHNSQSDDLVSLEYGRACVDYQKLQAMPIEQLLLRLGGNMPLLQGLALRLDAAKEAAPFTAGHGPANMAAQVTPSTGCTAMSPSQTDEGQFRWQGCPASFEETDFQPSYRFAEEVTGSSSREQILVSGRQSFMLTGLSRTTLQVKTL